MAAKILFLSYDGLTEALGQSQVLSYMKGLQSDKFEITIISFDKPGDYKKNGAMIRQQCDSAGIEWHSLPYRNKPVILSTVMMLISAWKLIKKLNSTHNFDIVHGRGGIISILAKKMKARYKTKFIYDMRGWWADEKLESGHWPSSVRKYMYLYFKNMERQMFLKSDFIVSLTEVGKSEIIRNNWKNDSNIGVVPTCTNLSLFGGSSAEESTSLKLSLGFPEGSKVLIYSGALGGNYPIEEIFLFLNAFLELSPEHYCLILSKDNLKIPLPERTVLRSVNYNEVSKYLSVCDFGFIYYAQAFSNIGRCPTKLGEYWACGLKVFCPANIGDINSLFAQNADSGYIIYNWNSDDMKNVIRQALTNETDRSKLSGLAKKYFSLSIGVDFYKGVYSKLISTDI